MSDETHKLINRIQAKELEIGRVKFSVKELEKDIETAVTALIWVKNHSLDESSERVAAEALRKIGATGANKKL